MRTLMSPAAGVAAVGLALVLVTSCTSAGPSEEAATETSRTSTASAGRSSTGTPTGPPTGSPTGPPTDEVAANEASVPEPPTGPDDRAGRAAFARYVLQAWVYSLNHNDPKPLLAVSANGTCRGCATLAEELAARTEQGWSVVLPAVEVGRVRQRSRTGGPATYRVGLTVDIPQSVTAFDDGRVRSRTPAHPDTDFVVDVHRVGGRFVLAAFSVR